MTYNINKMAMLMALPMMTRKLPEFKIKRAAKNFKGQGSKERQRRLRQQQRNKPCLD